MDEWQPIETAPKDGREILVCCFGDVFTAMYRPSNVTNNAPFFATSVAGAVWDCGLYYETEHEYRTGISHWMPLPTPPIQESE